MATWIVHLRTADQLLKSIPWLAPAPFAFGNLAPDCGSPDAGWEGRITHFPTPKGSPVVSEDLIFFRRYITAVRDGPVSPDMLSFRLGYFCHLLADNLWHTQINLPIHEKWAEQFAADPHFLGEIRKDLSGQDFRYLRANPNALFFRVFLPGVYEPVGLDFLCDDAVSQKMAFIKDFYCRQDDETEAWVARPMIYLSAAEMDGFVAYAARRIFDLYSILWHDRHDLGEMRSALEIA